MRMYLVPEVNVGELEQSLSELEEGVKDMSDMAVVTVVRTTRLLMEGGRATSDGPKCPFCCKELRVTFSKP